MQTYDIKNIEQGFALQYPEVLTQMVKPEGAGLVVPVGSLSRVPVFYAREGQI